MKIMVLSNKALGFFKFRRELIETLCPEHEVYLAFPDEEIKSKYLEMGCKYIPIEIDRRGVNPFADFKLFLKYRELVQKIKPDVVLTYTIKPNIYGGMVCRNARIPYIANVTGLGTSIENGGLLGFVAKTLYKIGLRKCACVFFQNQSNEQFFREHGIARGKTRILPGSGVNLDDFQYKEFPPIQDTVYFLFVGRIMEDKGITELIDAFEIIHSQYPNIKLDIVGSCEDNFYTYIHEKEKLSFVEYFGEKEDVHEFYERAHCVVLPSYHEGTANVLLEAAATGRPVITTYVPGCKETFDEANTGFGCEVKDVSSLVEAIESFLALSDDAKKKMGKLGRRKMERLFDRRIVVNAYMEEILNLCK